ncbi:hypothetical protein LT493_32040 [Streptomyces tricolor]|nr:hypothetical protein [Streptomyces tricolor]
MTELLTRLARMRHGRAALGGARPVGSGQVLGARCGLLPALVQGRLRVAGSAWWPRRVVTPTGDPVGVLAAVVEELTGTPAEQAAARLPRRPRKLRHPAAHRPSERLVLVVDQVRGTVQRGSVGGRPTGLRTGAGHRDRRRPTGAHRAGGAVRAGRLLRPVRGVPGAGPALRTAR